MQQLDFASLLELPLAIFAVVALLALPLALLATLGLIWLFRNAVRRSMAASGGAGKSIEHDRSPSAVGKGTLQIDRVDPTTMRPAAIELPALAHMRRQRRRAAWLYVAVTGACSLVLAVLMLVKSGFSPADAGSLKTVLLYSLFTLELSTPVVLAAAVVMTRRTLAMVFAVFLLVLAIWTADRFIGTDGVGLWKLLAGVPAVAVLLLNMRQFRAIGSIVYAAFIIGLVGAGIGQAYGALQAWDAIGPVTFVREDLAQLPLAEAGEQYLDWLLSQPLDQIWSNVSALRANPFSVIKPANPDGLTAAARLWFVGISIASALAGAIVAWLFMRWLGRSYWERRASDQMLTMDVLMVIFTLPVLLSFMATRQYFLAAGALGGLACYKALALFGFGWRQRLASKREPKALLLLRVFGFDRRTQGLLEDLGQRWRYLGPVRLIAGPDVAYTTIEPHEFYEFLAGRLSREFIKGPEDLESRLVNTSARPDPDGLYRIQDFFCHDDTWRMTVSRLARGADAVLMDVRGFGPTNQGCIYEIEQLIDTVDLDRITLLTDASTDLPLLESTLGAAWSSMVVASPNTGAGLHRLRVLQVSSGDRRTAERVLSLLCESSGQYGREEANLIGQARA